MLTINMDDTVKQEFCQIVGEMGLTATAAINLFARAVVREKAIPFPITLRSKEEQEWNDYLNDNLRRGVEDIAAGKYYTIDEAKKLLAEKEADR